jgi:hypothetical protein
MESKKNAAQTKSSLGVTKKANDDMSIKFPQGPTSEYGHPSSTVNTMKTSPAKPDQNSSKGRARSPVKELAFGSAVTPQMSGDLSNDDILCGQDISDFNINANDKSFEQRRSRKLRAKENSETPLHDQSFSQSRSEINLK